MIERLRADAVAAIRALRATPGPVVWAVVMLSVAVGLNLAMFGLVDRALLSPPGHVEDPGRLFTVGFESVGDEPVGGRMTTTSYVTFEAIRKQATAASGIAAWERTSTAAVIDSVQVSADAMLVSGHYFELLGARPQNGPRDPAAGRQ